MDYSKQGGGTRMPDQLKARTLATGIGQTYRAAREHGSHRTQNVVAGMKPGQHVSDPGLKQVKVKRDADSAAMLGLDPPPKGPEDPANEWPLSSGSKSHEDMGSLDTGHEESGEDTRVAATGRKAHHVKTTSPLAK